MIPVLLSMMSVALLSFPFDADAKQPRSTLERHAFVKEVACPATEKHRLPCPGWQIDHIEPLCAGGADHRSNMQWLTVEDHKAKTKLDVRVCSARRKER